MKHLSTLSLFACLSVPAAAQTAGLVFTQSNSPMGNELIALQRDAMGGLTMQGKTATGGTGTGMGLGSQGSVAFVTDRRKVLVVNAASNSLSAFRLDASGPTLMDVEPTQGIMPTSVTERDGRVYVLNAGGMGSIVGYNLSQAGILTPLPGAPAPLSSSMAAAAQVGITPDGKQLICSERATETIGVYPIAADGSLGQAQFLRSAGMTPFGFEFARGNNLIVSEAFGGAPDASAVSSYKLSSMGLPMLVSASVPTTETAACWIANTGNGRYSYTTNTGSGTVSGYRVMTATAQLEALNADGITGNLGAGTNPLDASISIDSRYLYVLSPATAEIAAFRIEENGSLSKLPSYMGVPATAFGLAAR